MNQGTDRGLNICLALLGGGAFVALLGLVFGSANLFLAGAAACAACAFGWKFIVALFTLDAAIDHLAGKGRRRR